MRLPEYTKEQMIAALESSAGIYSAAAMKLGCSRQCVSNYVQRYPEVAEALREIKDTNLDLAETKLLKNLRDGNMTALIFYLKTQGKERGYIEGREVSGLGGGPIPVEPTIDVSKLSLEERKQLRKLHLKAATAADGDQE